MGMYVRPLELDVGCLDIRSSLASNKYHLGRGGGEGAILCA